MNIAQQWLASDREYGRGLEIITTYCPPGAVVNLLSIGHTDWTSKKMAEILQGLAGSMQLPAVALPHEGRPDPLADEAQLAAEKRDYARARIILSNQLADAELPIDQAKRLSRQVVLLSNQIAGSRKRQDESGQPAPPNTVKQLQTQIRQAQRRKSRATQNAKTKPHKRLQYQAKAAAEQASIDQLKRLLPYADQ